MRSDLINVPTIDHIIGIVRTVKE